MSPYLPLIVTLTLEAVSILSGLQMQGSRCVLLGPAYGQDWCLPSARWRLSQLMNDIKPDGVILDLDKETPASSYAWTLF